MIGTHGDKVKSYTVACKYGILDSKWRGGDLQTHTANVECNIDIKLSLRQAASKQHTHYAYKNSLRRTASAQLDARTRSAPVTPRALSPLTTVTQNTHAQTRPHKLFLQRQQKSNFACPTLNKDLNIVQAPTGWLSDIHMNEANHLLKASFPRHGLQDTILQVITTSIKYRQGSMYSFFM